MAAAVASIPEKMIPEPAVVQIEKALSDPPSLNKLEIEQQTFDPVEEKKLLRKIDLHVIPILFLLFLCAFIDRINIGNARLQGLEADLKMKGSDYNIALFLFFIPYILFEVPCNILLKKMRPSIFLSAIILGWGVVTVGMGCVKTYGQLLACRLLIGALEAGFFPGCIYLISMYYKRGELQWRINLFFSASIIAGAFSGLLAYALAHMSGIGGYNGWRWIFIIEGAATVLIAACSFWIVPDWPSTAKFLNEQDKDLLLRRLAVDFEEARMDHWNLQTAKRVFGDIKIYLGILMYLGIVTTSYSTSFFTPTILKQLGWTALRAQIMSIPIFLAAAVCALTAAFFTDRFKHRYAFIIFGCLVTVTGYGILLSMMKVPIGARYFSLFLITCGAYIAQPITLVWLNNNLGGHYKRGVGAAMQVGLGNIGGIVASLIYLPTEAPTYHTGFGTGLGLVFVCIITSTVFLGYLTWENKQRNQGKRDHRFQLPEEERNNLGDDHPNFRFRY